MGTAWGVVQGKYDSRCRSWSEGGLHDAYLGYGHPETSRVKCEKSKNDTPRVTLKG